MSRATFQELVQKRYDAASKNIANTLVGFGIFVSIRPLSTKQDKNKQCPS